MIFQRFVLTPAKGLLRFALFPDIKNLMICQGINKTGGMKVHSKKNLTDFICRSFVILLLVFIHLSAMAQFPGKPADTTVMPALFKQIKETTNDRAKLKLYLQIGYLYLLKPAEFDRDMQLGLLYADKALKLASQLNDYAATQEAEILKGGIYRESGKWQLAKETLTKVTDRNNLKRLYFLVHLYYNLYLLDGSKDYILLDSCRMFLRNGMKRSVASKDKDKIDVFIELTFFLIGQNPNMPGLADEYNYLAAQTNASGDKELIAKVNYQLCQWHISKGDHVRALNIGLTALKYTGPEIRNRFQVMLISSIAEAYRLSKNFGKSNEYYILALTNTKGFDIPLYPIVSVICANFRSLGQFQKALEFLKDYVLAHPPKSEREQFEYHMAIGANYAALRQYAPAMEHYHLAVEIADKIGQPKENIYVSMANVYFHLKNFRKVRQLILDVESRASFAFIKPSYLAEVFMLHSRADSALGYFTSALKYSQKARRINDSIFAVSKGRLLEELNMQYQTTKEVAMKEKEANIRLLNQRNLQQQKQADFARKVSVAIFILLLIIILLIYRQYRLKQRSNRQFEISQRELDQKNAFLEALSAEQDKLLKEKEWLIKEVHHRVKNNLQMVTSLLSSQSAYLEDDAAIRAVKDSLRRMQAMSLIHQKLYQDENTSKIAMPEYINDLVSYLHDSFDTNHSIVFEQSIESLELDVSQAIPLGLIITESIVNAIKYAFLNEERGTVNISLEREGPDHLVLRVSDNGIGLPLEIDKMGHNSLGLDLMQGLAEQLKGTFDIENKNGVHITVRFIILKSTI
jgi:Signal transduction histidine kinase